MVLAAKVYYTNAADAADNFFKYIFYDVNWLFFCGWLPAVLTGVKSSKELFTAAG